jgi:TRAP-type C4-dicarboxylate transport system permease small subunit
MLNLLRTVNRYYGRLLSWLLAISVAILIFPVTLQVFSRYTELIPAYIWTEEMARFLFIWMIMIGAMVGIRESTHFEVDVWPKLGARGTALLKIVSSVFVLFMACIFVYYGWHFTRFAFKRISELAELPLWLIHIAWPLTGMTWIIFQGEQMIDAVRTLATGEAA